MGSSAIGCLAHIAIRLKESCSRDVLVLPMFSFERHVFTLSKGEQILFLGVLTEAWAIKQYV